MKTGRSVLVTLFIFFCFGCAGVPVADNGSLLGASGNRAGTFTAQSVIFSKTPSPKVHEKRLTGTMSINVRSGVKSYNLKIRLDGDSQLNETEVILAISGTTAGFGVYAKGNTLIEYSNGQVIGDSVIFENNSEEGKSSVVWLLGHNLLSSVIEAHNSDGDLLYSEVTTYDLSF